MRFSFVQVFLFSTLIAAFPSHAQENIIETARAAGSFNTLLAAVDAAGLTETLEGEGPFTVFAPTDDAFAALPEGTVEGLLEDTEALTNVLLYHVVSGSVLAADVVTLDSAETVQGSSVSISVRDDKVYIDEAEVVVTDIEASNGVIHVISSVLLPPAAEEEPGLIPEVAASAGRFNTLLAAVEAAGLAEALSGEGPFTVFAPNDDAFAALPSETLNALLADPEALADILLYHVVSGELEAADVLANSRLSALNGKSLTVSTEGDAAFINDSQILNVDIATANGVIHEIDTVLIPPVKTGTTYTVSVTNVTKGQVFSPPVAVAHQDEISLFQLGSPASGALAALAEDGDVSGLIADLDGLEQVYDLAQAGSVVAPGETVTFTIISRGNYDRISVAGMLVTTNDTFFSIELERPASRDYWFGKNSSARSESGMALAYDSGTEYNSEDCAYIPGPPCGNPGAQDSRAAEGFVHIANGVHGQGDLDAATLDWRGPVARIVITRD